MPKTLNIKKTVLFSIVFIILMFTISIYFYPQLPNPMASHWNSAGEVNGYMTKLLAVFLLPIISIGVFLLLYFIPYIDPKKENIDSFRCYYDWMIFALLFYLLYVHILTLLPNLGINLNISAAIIGGVGVLFYFIGSIMPKMKQNWLIGIRTPWTLSSEKVWDKTHKQGGVVFRIIGVLSGFGLFFGKYGIWFLLISTLLGIVYLFAYSYLEYKRL